MTGQTIRIAMGQLLVKAGDPQANLQRACEMIYKASADDCEIIVLPECMDLGWTYPGARELAEPVPGAHSDALANAAKEAGTWVVAGLTERFGDELYNAAVLISPSGNIVSKHRKINELEIAHDLYSIGDSLSVTRTPFGVIGINICADNLPDSLALGDSQARMGAQLLLSPSSWAVRPGHDNAATPYGDLWIQAYRSLAELYEMPVIGVSNVGWIEGGPWNGWKCIGCSLAVGSDGGVIAQGPYGDGAEALILVEVTIVNRPEKGTALTKRLAARGYKGA